MTSVCRRCNGEDNVQCPRCTPSRTNCWPGKRKERRINKKAIAIKCSFSSNP